MKILLHACCGPCSLEPVRLLRAAGHDLTIAYMNSNIAPADEYARRLSTLRAWAARRAAGRAGRCLRPRRLGSLRRTRGHRRGRSRPPQGALPGVLPPALRRGLRAGSRAGVRRTGHHAVGEPLRIYRRHPRGAGTRRLGRGRAQPLFEDYRPFYDEAAHSSREMGMYRQNYCGCRLLGRRSRHRARRTQGAASRRPRGGSGSPRRGARRRRNRTRRGKKAERAAVYSDPSRPASAPC